MRHKIVYSTAPTNEDGDLDPRSLLKRIAILSVVIAAVLIVAAVFYYYDASRLGRGLKGLRGVKSARLEGDHDGPLSWEINRAVIVLNGENGRVVHLRMPDWTELSNGNHIRLEKIGRYRLVSVAQDGSWPQYIDIGNSGPFSYILAEPVRDIQDLMDRYDELLIRIRNRVRRFRAILGFTSAFHPPAGASAAGRRR